MQQLIERAFVLRVHIFAKYTIIMKGYTRTRKQFALNYYRLLYVVVHTHQWVPYVNGPWKHKHSAYLLCCI